MLRKTPLFLESLLASILPPLTRRKHARGLHKNKYRKCLTILLHRKAFGPVPTGQHSRNGWPAGMAPLISWGAMERIYPRYPTIESLTLTGEERKMWMDLRPYVNTAPYVINGR